MISELQDVIKRQKDGILLMSCIAIYSLLVKALQPVSQSSNSRFVRDHGSAEADDLEQVMKRGLHRMRRAKMFRKEEVTNEYTWNGNFEAEVDTVM